MQTIGFVGLGKIGLPISENLIKSGYRVLGYRRSSMADFEKIGGIPARSPADVAAQTEIVFSCLPSSEALEEVVQGFADSCITFGPFGAASKVKLVNNLLVAVHIAAAAEAMALGLKAGVDVDLMIKAVATGSGGSTQFGIRAPWMAQRRFFPAQGTVPALAHYFDLIGEFADREGVATPMLDRSMELYQLFMEKGLGEHDIAAMVDVIGSLPRQNNQQQQQHGENA